MVCLGVVCLGVVCLGVVCLGVVCLGVVCLGVVCLGVVVVCMSVSGPWTNVLVYVSLYVPAVSLGLRSA